MRKWHEKWRRFRPQRSMQRERFVAHGHYEGLFAAAWRTVDDATQGYDTQSYEGIDQLDRIIDEVKARATSAADWLALILLQTPRAARAQAQMDAHKSNYHNRQERLFELIDYNDSFVNTVLLLAPSERKSFAERLRKASDEFCRRVQTPNFSDEQFDAIVRGLSREIAVYLGALDLGYNARMTSRNEDAFGIDMVLEDQEGRVLNIDVKTPSAFRHRMGELEFEGRMSEEEFLRADERDYFTHIHSHQGSRIERIPVTLLCIRHEHLGDIVDFEFVNPKPLGELLAIIAEEGDRHYERAA